MYLEYEECKNKYYNAQKEYDKILNKQEKLFSMTQPKSTDYSKDRTTGGEPQNTFEEYMIQKEKEKIDEKLKEALSILKNRKMLFDMKEEDLRRSKDWYDIIYVYSYLEKMSSRKIERRVPFCKTDICNKLKEIRKNIDLDKSGQK